jgi:hypothetical protein
MLLTLVEDIVITTVMVVISLTTDHAKLLLQ